MKKIILLATLMVATIAMSQNLSKVNTVNGIEVYLLADPLREYEILDDTNNKIKWGSFLTAGLINESISTKVSKFVKALKKEMNKNGVKFDAVIYTSGKNMTAIKFTEEATPENKRLATIHKLDGVPYYVMSEPVDKYIIVNDIHNGIMWKSLVTVGLWNNSIEQDLLKFSGKVDGKFRRGKIDAIIYSSGKKAISIKIEDTKTSI